MIEDTYSSAAFPARLMRSTTDLPILDSQSQRAAFLPVANDVCFRILRRWISHIVTCVTLFFFSGLVPVKADCEAPVTFMGAGWYYCEEEYDGERSYYAAPGELIFLSSYGEKPWGVAIGCTYPPKWKFWADEEFYITFIVANTNLKIGDVSLTVQSKTYDAQGSILDPDPDEGISSSLHKTIINDPDSVSSIIENLNNHDKIRWKYSDSSRVYTIGILTLPGVLPYVLQKCDKAL